jgi:hypothetical protein
MASTSSDAQSRAGEYEKRKQISLIQPLKRNQRQARAWLVIQRSNRIEKISQGLIAKADKVRIEDRPRVPFGNALPPSKPFAANDGLGRRHFVKLGTVQQQLRLNVCTAPL